MPRTEESLSSPGQSRKSLLLIVFVALALRLIVVAFLWHDQMNPYRGFWAFGYETGRIARSIVMGEGFANPLYLKTGPTAWMTPVYPYLMAGVFKISGIYTPATAVILLSLNSLFSALTCVPVFFMARDSFGSKAAIWSAWAWALFPYAIFLSAERIWETCLTTLLLSILFLITLRLERSTRLAAWAGFGLLWGFTALSDPAVLSLFPFLAGWACYRLHKQGHRWGMQAGVLALALCTVVTPWFVRNYRTFHQFIPFRDNFWLQVHVGNNGDTSHWAPDAAHPSWSSSEEEQYNTLGEIEYMAEKKREAVGFVRSHLGWFVWVTLRRIFFTWTGFWSFAPKYLAMEPLDPANILLCTPLTLLALWGLRRAFREKNAAAAPYAFVLAAFPLVYYVTFSQMPYRHRIDPQIVVLATYGVIDVISRWTKKRPAAV
jgi:4-amino-4-deoxy-L-arabinose transferase-like glycosyltransferase